MTSSSDGSSGASSLPSSIKSVIDGSTSMLKVKDRLTWELSKIGLKHDLLKQKPVHGTYKLSDSRWQSMLVEDAATRSDDGTLDLGSIFKGGDTYRLGHPYKIFHSQSTSHIAVIQYPNRDPGQSYSDAHGDKPLAMRIKPKSGLVEVDIAFTLDTTYDMGKGLIYGEAMRKNEDFAKSQGIAGGFGINGKRRSVAGNAGVRRNMKGSPIDEDNYEGPRNDSHVLDKITLSGQIVPFRSGDPIYKIGVCRGDELHLSKVDSIVQLRPQLSHLDALQDLENPVARNQRDHDNGGEPSEARAINMSVKSAENEDMDLSMVAKTLRNIAEEPWQPLQWIDEEDTLAYQYFDEKLYFNDTKNAPALMSAMSKGQWLDSMSAPRIDPIQQAQKIVTSNPYWSDDNHHDSEFSSEEESADVHNYKHPRYKPPKGMVVPKQESRVLIEKFAEAVGQRGELFEMALKEILQDTPRFSFMSEDDRHYDYYESRVCAYWEGGWEQHDHEVKTQEQESLQRIREILAKVEARKAESVGRKLETSDWNSLTAEEMVEYHDIKKSLTDLNLPKPSAVNLTHEQSRKKMQAIIKTCIDLKGQDEPKGSQDIDMND